MTIAAGELELDPFAYVPDMASRITGLGGYDRPAEGDYALHTHYVEATEGPAHFTLTFDDLTATRGTLNLRVHMLTGASPHATLATAHAALDHALARATAHGVRVILLITGKPLRQDSHGRQRGLIRAAIFDWLAGSRFASRIAAVRGAHPRHGGTGALYLILRRERTG